MTTIAFVTPWYGPGIPGGAEALTRRTAEQLHQAGLPVEILTTCIRDFHADWGKNHYQPGLDAVNGVPVRRFPVQKRDAAAFDRVNWRLMQNLPVTAAQAQTFIDEMFRAPALYEYMATQAENYLYILIPYMFATTVQGAAVCPQRTLAIPCFHEESYVRLPVYGQALANIRGMIFLSPVEAGIADKYVGTAAATNQVRQVLGGGVDTDFSFDAARFRQKYGLTQPFVLYAGRREMGKNTPLLIDYWQRYRAKNGSSAQLVLIGSGAVEIPPDASDHILDLGFVPVQDKYDAFAAADVFCMPSVHESFSIVIMESWLAGTPVLVHGRCDVTRSHVVQANGGLYFNDYHEFAATLDYLLDHPQQGQVMARQGKQYVLANFHWDVVTEKYRDLIEEIVQGTAN